MTEFKIKDLENLTGIKAHTLRIWEKRYNLLSPERTETKIRTYSEQDVMKILNVSILYNNGWKISKIAKCSGEEIDRKVARIFSTEPCCNTNISMLIQAMIELRCDEFSSVLEKIIKKDGLEITYQSCLSSFMKRIEALWKLGRITPVQRHFVINKIRQKLISEIERLPIVEKDRFDAVLFTPDAETNELELLFYHYLLKKRKYKILYLGVNLPILEIKRTLYEANPRNIVISLAEDRGEECYQNYIKELTSGLEITAYLGGEMVNTFGLPNHKFIEHFSRLIH